MNSLIRSLSRNFWLKIALCALLFAGAGILPITAAHGATIKQTNFDDLSNSVVANPRQKITGLGGEFTDFTFKVASGNYTTPKLVVTQLDGNCGYDYPPEFGYQIWESNNISPVGEGEIIVEAADFEGSAPTFRNDACYDFLIYQLNRRIYGTEADLYAGGEAAGADNLVDLYFIINDTSSESYLIDFVFPENEQTIEDFISWQILSSSPELDPEETPRYYIVVAYNREGSEDIYTDGYYSLGGVDLYSGVFKSQILTGGIWEATAKIFYNDFEDPLMLLDSETITFTIGISEESGIPLPEGVDCNSGNFIADSFCHIISYLFIPSSESLNLYQNLLDPIKNKAPFGYFTLLKNELKGLGESTPAFDLNVEGFGFFGMIRTGLVWIIWLWAGVGIFKRLAHLEI